MSILYTIGDDSLYINVTNRCPLNCVFCIRNNGDYVGDSGNMWFEKDPTYEEIIKEFENRKNLDNYNEIVFCGYGEPLCALENVLKVCDYIKKNTNLSVRINTNGLSDIINRKDTAILLKNRVDCISISLNAPSAKEYVEVTQTKLGEKAFDAMLKFATDCKKYVPSVVFTVVDVIGEEKIKRCEKISKELGIPLRIRKYIETY